MSLINDMDNEKLFTKSEKLVVQYLKEHPYEVIDMTIGQLAKITFSSNTTIIRICKKLGFKGFKEFKIAYTKNIESLKYLDTAIDFTFPFRGNEPTHEIIHSITNVYKETIDLVNSELNVKELEEIANILDKSQKVYIYALGDSKITALTFINKLVKIGKFFSVATENDEELTFAKYTTSKDCAFYITYGGLQPSYIPALKILWKNDCKVIILTANPDTPLVKYATKSIVVPYKEEDEKIATFYSQQAFNYILSIIYSLLYKKHVNKNTY